ncbi:hypothetical protein [Alloacidobacterium sp.]|uniref:hypothetical protein n=1 Tax=Alloacidobacterium sp. TaxID=2951999 RepID=UPI002D2436F1|nr:hypothetical protein [Alloacidobacterium sp.]HYK35110.1 hypothetical protein [Alloacidobacterium sp.]
MVQTATERQPDFRNFDALIVDQLTDAERARSVVYLDEQLRPPGQIAIGGSKYERSDPFVLAFVDRKPGANWMHPCRYLLINPVTRNITLIDSDRPPLFGALPPTWRVVWRSPDIDDWRLLPISRPLSQH